MYAHAVIMNTYTYIIELYKILYELNLLLQLKQLIYCAGPVLNHFSSRINHFIESKFEEISQFSVISDGVNY